MSFFIRLVEATDKQRRQLEQIPKLKRMIHEGLSKEEYITFLSNLYPIVWHFCPIMAAAAARCGEENNLIRYHLYASIDEERGHEAWVLNDLNDLGADPEEIKRRKPCSAVQAFIGFNYYSPEHVHAASVLGMLYSLEFISSVYGGQVAQSVAQSLSMKPEAGFTFLQSHNSLDLDHMAKLNQVIKSIEDREAQEAIINVANVNFYLLGEFVSS